MNDGCGIFEGVDGDIDRRESAGEHARLVNAELDGGGGVRKQSTVRLDFTGVDDMGNALGEDLLADIRRGMDDGLVNDVKEVTLERL